MGPGGLTLDAYKGRSFHVKRKEEVRLHETPRTPSSEHGGPKKQDKLRHETPHAKVGDALKYSKPDYYNKLVYADSGDGPVQPAPDAEPCEDAGYKRMPARETQLFSGTLEKKVVRAKVSWEPRHAVITGKCRVFGWGLGSDCK